MDIGIGELCGRKFVKPQSFALPGATAAPEERLKVAGDSSPGGSRRKSPSVGTAEPSVRRARSSIQARRRRANFPGLGETVANCPRTRPTEQTLSAANLEQPA